MVFLGVSYLSGIIAAFTPCVIVLFPLLFYRFFNKEAKQWKSFGLVVLGFLFSYALLGFFLGNLLTSAVQNGIKISLGLLFIILGVLSFFDKINPLQFPLIKQPFLLGAVIASLLSFNPCTIPYLSIIISFTSASVILAHILAFGLGLLTPALLFAFFGQQLLDIGKKTGKFFHHLNKLMSLLLVITGIYLALTISALAMGDILLVSFFLLFLFFFLLRTFFLVNHMKDLLHWQNLFLLLALFLFIGAAFFHCKAILEEANKPSLTDNPYLQLAQANAPHCGENAIEDCPVCRRCLTIFTLATLIGFFAIFRSAWWKYR